MKLLLCFPVAILLALASPVALLAYIGIETDLTIVSKINELKNYQDTIYKAQKEASDAINQAGRLAEAEIKEAKNELDEAKKKFNADAQAFNDHIKELNLAIQDKDKNIVNLKEDILFLNEKIENLKLQNDELKISVEKISGGIKRMLTHSRDVKQND